MAFALLGARSTVARRFYQTSVAGRCRLHHTCLRPRGPSRPAAPPRLTHPEASRRSFFSWQKPKKTNPRSAIPAAIVVGTLLITSLYPHDEIQRLKTQEKRSKQEPEHAGNSTAASEQNAWFDFSTRFEQLSNSTDVEWGKISDKLVETIFPEWSKYVPGYVRKLQREMSMAPGSLADEIWDEAHDPLVNPEVQYTAKVRISDDLCEEEKEFLVRRKRIATVALARYLGLKEEDVHPDDVPTIAMCGSGGGLRALVAGTGSWTAASEDGLFDCVTYTSGVSGSCWLQSLYYSSITGQDVGRLADHLKARLGVHIAYPPVAFQALTSAPTNKYLLSGVVEKLKGDTRATFGLVDVYGILLAARLLVPKGELGVNERDFKLSNQRQYVKYGQNPLPIYTAVRHEIPDAADETNSATGVVTEEAKAKAKQEAWFQWFEITPYEFFCEEFSAGIPTWALGRKFKDGQDVPPERGFHLPELRMPLMLGIFGSAFCATLSHYYREIRPLIKNLTGFGAVDELVYGHNEDLSKVHPIDPAMLPNPVYGMKGKLPKTTPSTLYDNEYIQLMDAGMSNNIPLYPFLRPGRNVEIVIAFDASADIKTDNWLSVADGYARQRGIKGWPVGIGWPKPGDSPKKLAKELDESSAGSSAEAEAKLSEAKAEQEALRRDAGRATDEDAVERRKYEQGEEAAGELGYCTVWVGTTQERSSGETPPPSKAVDDSSDWQLMEPDAGITVVYLPFLVNDKVPGVDPAASEYMSTWNFVYTPEQVDQVMALARANYAEGRERIRRTVRAVYERKKKVRLEEAARRKEWRYRKLVRKGVAHKLGEGDQFS